MKKRFLIIALILGIMLPSYAVDKFQEMSIEEYSKYFEMGLIDDEQDEEHFDEFEAKKPDLKNKKDEILKTDTEPIKLKIEKKPEIAPYKQTYSAPSGKNELIKTEKFTVFSDTKGEMNNYMRTDVKSSVNASYKVNKALDVKMGQEVWYVNQDASLGAKKLYINPKLNLSKSVYLDYAGKYNEQNKDVEQEVGINFKPKVFKDNATFGIKAGSKINEEKDTQSGKLKFTTDWYIF